MKPTKHRSSQTKTCEQSQEHDEPNAAAPASEGEYFPWRSLYSKRLKRKSGTEIASRRLKKNSATETTSQRAHGELEEDDEEPEEV